MTCHFYAYGARLAAEKFKLPYVNVCLSTHWLKGFVRPSGLRSMLQRLSASSMTKFVDGQLFAKPMGALRAEIGLEPMKQSSRPLPSRLHARKRLWRKSSKP